MGIVVGNERNWNEKGGGGRFVECIVAVPRTQEHNKRYSAGRWKPVSKVEYMK